MKFVMSGDELISMKETFGLCVKEGQNNIATSLETDMIHVRIWLVSSALESVKVVYGLRRQQSRV